MAVPQLILRTLASNGVLQPENVYHILSPLSTNPARAAVAQSLADAQAELIADDHVINEWRYVDATGIEIDSGTLNTPGLRTSQPVSFYLCLYVELLSNGPKSPSSKYIHGYTEGMADEEKLNTATLLDLNAYGNALVANAVTDSDGFGVYGVRFGHFGRRRRVRKKAV